MQGQANHFFKYAPEKIPYGIKRYQDETKRLYKTYEDHLAQDDKPFLVGGKYSLADIVTAPWVRMHDWCGVGLDEFPKLAAWVSPLWRAATWTAALVGVSGRGG